MCGTCENSISPFTPQLEEKMLLVGMTYVSFAVNKYTVSMYIEYMHNNNTSSLHGAFFPGTKTDPSLLLSHLSLQTFSTDILLVHYQNREAFKSHSFGVSSNAVLPFHYALLIM